MENNDKKLSKKLLWGIRQAQIKMLVKKMKLGEMVIIGDENGMPIKVTAEEALKNYPEYIPES